jgi:hypothetical protein
MTGEQVPGKLDEISRLLGNLESGLREIERRSVEDRETGNRRHAENQQAIAASKQAVQDLKDIVELLSATVASWRPTVEAFTLSRSKLTAWASIGFVAIAFLGWIVEAIVKWAVTAALLHWR